MREIQIVWKKQWKNYVVVHISYCRFKALPIERIFRKAWKQASFGQWFLEICSEIRKDYLFYLEDIEKNKQDYFK